MTYGKLIASVNLKQGQDKSVDLLSYCLLGNHVDLLVETPKAISPRDASLSDELYSLL
jgi:hypothetical protein